MKRSPWILLAGLAVMVTGLALHQIYDPDFWLHLAAGQWQQATGSVPRLNTFSFTFPDYPWLDVYWLYQRGLAGIWEMAGPGGIVVLRIGLCLAVLGLVLLAARPAAGALSNGAAATVLIAWVLLAPRLTDRPELVSYVLLAGIMAAVAWQKWWWCIPLQILWANVQGYFLLGPVLVAVAGLTSWRQDPASARRAWQVAAVMAVACVISPFGVGNLSLLREFAGTLRGAGAQVEELVSPLHPAVLLTDGSGWLLLVYIGLLALFARRMPARYLAWALVTLPMALLVRRAIPVFVLCSLPGLIAAVPRWEGRPARLVVVALCLAVAVGLNLRGQRRGTGVNTERLPAGAVEFLQREPDTTRRVWNTDFAAGGFLAAHGVAPFVDGRLEAYPAMFLEKVLAAGTRSTTAEELAREHAVTDILVSTRAADGAAWMQRLPGWTGWSLVYQDESAAVFRRSR